MSRLRLLIHTSLLLLSTNALVRADVVILSDVPGGDKPLVSREVEQADQYFSPASTFKMIIALVAFEKGLATATTVHLCADNHLPKKPMKLDFQQAMYYSSNEYFVKLMEDIDGRELVEMAERCGFGKAVGPMPKNKSAWRHGGNIRVTPMQEHLFLRNLAQGSLPVDRKVQSNLVRVMKWPSPVDGVKAFGKTGSWERTYWFSGMAVIEGQPDRICTVTLTSFGSNRDKAISTFFQQIKRPLPNKDE